MICLLLTPVVSQGQQRLAGDGSVPNSEGVTPTPIPGALTIGVNQLVMCAGDHATIEASGGNGVYTWTPNRNLSATTGSKVVAGPLVNESYTVTSTNPNTGAPVSATVNLQVAENCCPSSQPGVYVVDLPLSRYDANTGSPFAGQPAGTRFHFIGASPIVFSGLAFQPPVGSVLLMDAGKDLYLQDGASLDLSGVSITAACNDMWGALVVQPSAAGLTANKSGTLMSQVSHSFGGIVCNEGSAWLRLNYTQFLHNRFGITFGRIANGAPGNYVTNCLFDSEPASFKAPWNYQTSTNYRYTAAHITVGGDVSQASISNNTFKNAMYGLTAGTGAEVGLRPAATATNANGAVCCPQYLTKINLVSNTFDNIWLAGAQMISPVIGSSATFTSNSFNFPTAVALPNTPQVQTLVSQRSGDATTYGIFNKSQPLLAVGNDFNQGTAYSNFDFQTQRTIQTAIRTTGQLEARGNYVFALHRGIHLDQGYTGSCTVVGNRFASCQYGLYVSRLTQSNAQLAVTCNTFIRNSQTTLPGTNYGIYVDATSVFTFVLPAVAQTAPVLMNKFDAAGQNIMWAIYNANNRSQLIYTTFDDYVFGTAMLTANVTRNYPGIFMAMSGQNCGPVYPYYNGIYRLHPAPPPVAAVALAAHPNPAGGSTTIRYEVPGTAKQAVLRLRRLSDGREVGRFELAVQGREYELALSAYPSGLYAYSLLVDELPVATQRLEVR